MKEQIDLKELEEDLIKAGREIKIKQCFNIINFQIGKLIRLNLSKEFIINQIKELKWIHTKNLTMKQK